MGVADQRCSRLQGQEMHIGAHMEDTAGQREELDSRIWSQAGNQRSIHNLGGLVQREHCRGEQEQLDVFLFTRSAGPFLIPFYRSIKHNLKPGFTV